jgi:peptidoglycan/LPS O-acetylase OafA/YrhL
MLRSRTGRGELRALTALRFVLALYALLYHVLFAWNPIVPRDGGGPLAAVLSAGYVSVNGFFVLSGFVLVYAYAAPPEHTHTTSVRRYLWARFARIYPMHVVGVLLSLPLFFAASRAAHARDSAILDEALREAGAVGLLVQAWIPAHALDLNGPSWSLSVELFFYACFPWLLRWVAPRSVRSLVIVALAAFALALTPPLLHPIENGIEGASLADRVVLYDPLAHLPEFILGMTAGLAFLRERPSGPSWKIVSVGCSIAIVGALALSPRVGVGVGLLHSGLFDPLLALLVFALAASEPPRSSHVSPTPFSLSNLLGRASYALYILHKPIYLWMARESGLGRRVPGTAFVLTYVGASLLLSILLWRTVEEPARRWLQGRSRASPVRAAS